METMNTTLTPSTGFASSERVSTQTTKLASLLALASGAVALPQNAAADIIFTDLSSNPQLVGWNASSSLIFTVPGTANVGFERQAAIGYTSPGSLTVNFRSVKVGNLGGGADAGVRGLANGFVAPLLFGATWDQGDGALADALVGTANDLNLFGGRRPASDYNNQYVAWYFEDSTQGNALRYGWAQINLNIVGYNAGGPTVTVLGYAYDNTGAKPNMGAVPEPSTGALLALSALALGARGLRQWRAQRIQAHQA
jgi:hypothetical protein